MPELTLINYRVSSMDGAYPDHCLLDHIARRSAFTVFFSTTRPLMNDGSAGPLRTCWIFSFRRPCSLTRAHHGTAISSPKEVYEIYRPTCKNTARGSR